jgi:MFS transporter, CP family, cyanate transporter
MLAVVTGVSLPLTLLLPLAMRITGHTPWLPVAFSLLTIAGWLGVLLAPTTATWLWAALLGAGSTVFTWVLALIGQKSRTLAGTAALSGFVQGLGYLLATVGPFGAGWLHERTGSWTATLLGLVVLAALTGGVGVLVNRPRVLEDDLHVAR